MSVSHKVKCVLALSGKKQNDLAAKFNKSKQSMSNKVVRNFWTAEDLVKIADFCGCKLMFVFPDGQQIVIDNNEDT